jgi:hypothetical protein
LNFFAKTFVFSLSSFCSIILKIKIKHIKPNKNKNSIFYSLNFKINEKEKQNKAL